MGKPPVTIEIVRQKDLVAFAERVASDARRFEVAPIIRRRAAALSRNPDAREEDVVMVLAFCGGKCVGYHGLLPGMLADGAGCHKVFWCSAFYVSPTMRRQGIAGKILDRMKQTGADIVVTAATDSAMGAYLKSGAKKLGDGRYLSIRPEKVIPKPLIRTAAGSTSQNSVFSRALRWSYDIMKKYRMYRAMSGIREAESGVRVESVRNISAGFRALPETLPCFYRDADAVNWMLSDPWLYSAEETPEEMRPPELSRYHFTGIRNRFTYRAFTLKSTREKGFFTFLVSSGNRRTTVKLLDHNLPTAAFRQVAARRLLGAGFEEGADRIDMPWEMVSTVQRNPAAAPMVKRKSRSYWIVSEVPDGPLARSAGRIHLQLHDGEQAFT